MSKHVDIEQFIKQLEAGGDVVLNKETFGRVARQLKQRGKQGTGNNEWITPPEIIRLERRVLGGIDLDPLSCVEAQRIVKARRYFTEKDDGLQQKWSGRVHFNPPYEHVILYDRKLVDEYQAGHVTAAIAVQHNYTDTKWFHEVMVCNCDAFCHYYGPPGARRVPFIEIETIRKAREARGKPYAGPAHGQIFFYFGKNVGRFHEVFSEVGAVHPGYGRRQFIAFGKQVYGI
jgi:hypothetical protein